MKIAELIRPTPSGPMRPADRVRLVLSDHSPEWPSSFQLDGELFIWGGRYHHAASLGADCFYMLSQPEVVDEARLEADANLLRMRDIEASGVPMPHQPAASAEPAAAEPSPAAKPNVSRPRYKPEEKAEMVAKLDALELNHTLTFRQPDKVRLLRYATQVIRLRDGIQQFSLSHLGDGKHQVRRIAEGPANAPA